MALRGVKTGKDFVTAFIVLWFFLTRNPCRIVTTSVDCTQLEAVLWGEMGRFIQTSRVPLDSTKGGPLLVNHQHIRKKLPSGLCRMSYIVGRVAAKGESLLGHHVEQTGDGIPRTLLVGDEASGLSDTVYENSDTWANRKLFIGNPYPSSSFFKRCVQGGDILP